MCIFFCSPKKFKKMHSSNVGKKNSFSLYTCLSLPEKNYKTNNKI